MLLINGAGGTAADPILAGLGMMLTFGASTFDIDQVNDVWIDQAAGFPGSNTVKSSLSPAATVLTSGSTGSYNDTSKEWTISSTTGMSSGDAIYLSHANITDGLYIVDSVVNGTNVTIKNNPLNGASNQSNIFYQAAWSKTLAAGVAPSVASAGGTQNWFKGEAQDANPVVSQLEDSFFLRNAPAGATFVSIEGGGYSGGTVSDTALTLAVLASWVNRGGVAFVELANHSVQGVNNFVWTSGLGTGEVALATAENGLTISGGDGQKYGRLIFKAMSGSGLTVGVDIDVDLDTTGPSLVLLATAA